MITTYNQKFKNLSFLNAIEYKNIYKLYKNTCSISDYNE